MPAQGEAAGSMSQHLPLYGRWIPAFPHILPDSTLLDFIFESLRRKHRGRATAFLKLRAGAAVAGIRVQQRTYRMYLLGYSSLLLDQSLVKETMGVQPILSQTQTQTMAQWPMSYSCSIRLPRSKFDRKGDGKVLNAASSRSTRLMYALVYFWPRFGCTASGVSFFAAEVHTFSGAGPFRSWASMSTRLVQ